LPRSIVAPLAARTATASPEAAGARHA